MTESMGHVPPLYLQSVLYMQLLSLIERGHLRSLRLTPDNMGRSDNTILSGRNVRTFNMPQQYSVYAYYM
jgi:hypothetical protein